MAAAKKEQEEENLVEIVEMPIEISRYVDHVRDPAAGAIATFEGTTRDTFEGRRVVELRYEAYVPMALRRLRAACAAARAAWSIRRLAVAHRLGVVPVGEASVLVAASAAHRADALEACRFLIDEVKASVPIWKKEVYEDGEMWKENAEFIAAGQEELLVRDISISPLQIYQSKGDSSREVLLHHSRSSSPNLETPDAEAEESSGLLQFSRVINVDSWELVAFSFDL